MNGGMGYTPNQVGQLTPDQIYFSLCSREMIQAKAKKDLGNGQGSKISELEASLLAKDGKLKARSADGKSIEIPYKQE